MKDFYKLRVFSILGIFSLALAVRFTYNITVARNYYPLHDSLTYQTIAYGLLRDHCYCLLPHLATVDRAPLWPMIIAVVYGLLGPHDFFVRLLLCLVGSGTCVITYCFARDMFGSRCGIFAGILAASYPFLFVYDGWLYSESLYTFFLLAFCYTLYHIQRTPKTKLLLLNGVLLGLLSLVRPNGLLLFILFLLWAFVMGRSGILSRIQAIRSAITISLIALILVLPWTARNYVVTHSIVPVAVGDGKVLLGAYNDQILEIPFFLGIWIIPSTSTPAIARQFPADCARDCEVTRDNTYKYYAWQWVIQHKRKMPYLLSLHFLNMWQTTTQEADLAINRFTESSSSRIVVKMMEVMTPVVFALAGIGFIRTLKRWRELLFIYFIAALTIMQCIAFYGIPRFRAPLEPMLILLAAGALWAYRRTTEQAQQEATQKQAATGLDTPIPVATAIHAQLKPNAISQPQVERDAAKEYRE